MSFPSILKDIGLLVAGAYLGGGAGVLVPRFTKEPYNFFSFINGLVKEYIFRIKPKNPPVVQ